MTTAPNPWPNATRKLLPNVLFDIADKYPDVAYVEYFADPVDIAAGYRKVSYRDLANAVTEMAWWIEENVGKPEANDGSETLVYFGGNDLRYGILVFASVLVGYKMLFPSPRYGADAIAKLINTVGSRKMLVSNPAPPIYQEVLSHHSMETCEIPSLDALWNATPRQRYPFTKTWESAHHEPLVCLHTSGTTGFPKPIIWPHSWASSADESKHFDPPAGYEGRASTFNLYGPGKRVMFPFPPFHGSGVIGQVLVGLGTGSVMIYPPPAISPADTMELCLKAMDFLASQGGEKLHWQALPPPHAEYLASDPDFLKRFSERVSVAVYGGGDIATRAGNAIASKMPFWTIMASTELSIWPSILEIQPPESPAQAREEAQEDWHYLNFHPKFNVRFDHVSDSDEGPVCEGIVVRNEEGGWLQPCFTIHKDKKEFRLEDLFVQHPRKKHLWKHYGRVDDLLNFITTEKFHPAAAERQLAMDPNVDEIMMVGTRRPAAALIVKLKEDATVNNMWETVEAVNETSAVYARVKRDMILVVNEPFLKTAKGSVRKKAMLEKYQKELDALYEGKKVEGMFEGSTVTP